MRIKELELREKILQALSNKSKHLNLKLLGIQDADLPLICNVLNEFSDIKSLDLSINSIKDEGAELLSKNLRFIEKLNLYCNLIKDVGAKHFSSNTNLKYLNFGDNQNTSDGCNALLNINKYRENLKNNRAAFLFYLDKFCESDKSKCKYIPVELKKNISEFAFGGNLAKIEITYRMP